MNIYNEKQKKFLNNHILLFKLLGICLAFLVPTYTYAGYQLKTGHTTGVKSL